MASQIQPRINIANTLYSEFVKSSKILQAVRKESGMSQAELARSSGLAQSVISDYERGNREPGADTFLHLLDILGMGIDLKPKRRTKVPQIPDSRLARLILRNRKQIIELAKRSGARNVRIFGSIAKGESKKRSDIDLLVDLDPDVGMIELIGLEHALKDLLGVKVDLGSARSLKPDLRDEVLSHAINL